MRRNDKPKIEMLKMLIFSLIRWIFYCFHNIILCIYAFLIMLENAELHTKFVKLVKTALMNATEEKAPLLSKVLLLLLLMGIVTSTMSIIIRISGEQFIDKASLYSRAILLTFLIYFPKLKNQIERVEILIDNSIQYLGELKRFFDSNRVAKNIAHLIMVIHSFIMEIVKFIILKIFTKKIWFFFMFPIIKKTFGWIKAFKMTETIFKRLKENHFWEILNHFLNKLKALNKNRIYFHVKEECGRFKNNIRLVIAYLELEKVIVNMN